MAKYLNTISVTEPDALGEYDSTDTSEYTQSCDSLEGVKDIRDVLYVAGSKTKGQVCMAESIIEDEDGNYVDSDTVYFMVDAATGPTYGLLLTGDSPDNLARKGL